MENKLQKIQTHISTQTFDITALPIIAKISLVRHFPMSKEETELWTSTIFRLEPKTTVQELQEVIDGFITGRYNFDKDLGIRNIFKALKLLRNNDLPTTYFETL